MKLGRLRDAVAQNDPFFDIAADRVDGKDMTKREKPCGQRLVLAHQPEQNVLGRDDLRTVLECLVPGEEYDPSGPLRIAFKHKTSISASFVRRHIITKNRQRRQ